MNQFRGHQHGGAGKEIRFHPGQQVGVHDDFTDRRRSARKIAWAGALAAALAALVLFTCMHAEALVSWNTS